MTKRSYNYCVATALAIAALLTATGSHGQSLRITAPLVLPRNQQLGQYSPLVSFAYSGLRDQPYKLKVWLLEENAWNCASTQWCEETFAVGSGRDGAPNGSLEMVLPFDVFDYGPSLTWVGRLFDGSGVEVASAKLRSKTVAAEPPVLKRVGKRVGLVGQELRFRFSAASPPGDKVTFRLHGAPSDATLDAQAGLIIWTPAAAGLYRIVVEAVSQRSGLTDAEVVQVDIARPAGLLDEEPAAKP